MEIYSRNALEHMALLAGFYMHVNILAININLCTAGTMRCLETASLHMSYRSYLRSAEIFSAVSRLTYTINGISMTIVPQICSIGKA